jgi:hypothetical protein
MEDMPSRPDRRKLTLGEFTSIIMTQISSPEEPLEAPNSHQRKKADGE